MIITFLRRLLNFIWGIGMICTWEIYMTTIWFILLFISSTLRSRIPSSKTIHRELSIGSVRTHFNGIDNQCKYWSFNLFFRWDWWKHEFVRRSQFRNFDWIGHSDHSIGSLLFPTRTSSCLIVWNMKFQKYWHILKYNRAR